MKDFIVAVRNSIIKFIYKGLLKPVFFLSDPERVHDGMTFFGRLLGSNAITRWKTKVLLGYSNPVLEQTVAGIHFKNPVGLAAGFDKDAHLTKILPSVGFGFEEVGSVTGEPCKGNNKPRLWRLKNSRSLLVYYGLKNDGCEAVSERLLKMYDWDDNQYPLNNHRSTSPVPSGHPPHAWGGGKQRGFPIGVSIAKTNSPDTVDEQEGIDDYVKAYSAFVQKNIGDYFTINISCPNAFGGEPFTTPEKLERLLSAIRQVHSSKPVFIKMPAEVPPSMLDQIIEVARKHHITGFVCTNLAKDRSNGHIKDLGFPSVGGMSGKVVQQLSDDQIAYIYRKTRGEFVIVGCGGVFSAEDAYRKIRSGASLIQMITGMIFEGPETISEINRGLANLLKQDGYSNISEAVGKGLYGSQ